MSLLVFHGTFIHATSGCGDVEVIHDGYLAVSTADGVIQAVHKGGEDADVTAALLRRADRVIHLGDRMLLPGFVDGHAHAPQYAFAGLGMSLPLMQWLEKHTFPCESNFSDLAFASKVYTSAVDAHLRRGSTTVSYFATIHTEASIELARIAAAAGQRALVGKVSMDMGPDYYREEEKQALPAARRFVEALRGLSPLVEAVITPRFAPACTAPLMAGLADLAEQYGLPVQSHLNESPGEIELVAKLHGGDSYTAVYDDAGLLSSGRCCYMAHCVHCTPGERQLMAQRGTAVIHCPNSNFSLGSGVCDVRQLLADGIVVGLGTDVAGGYSSSMLDAIRMAIVASHASSFAQSGPSTGVHRALSPSEAFSLATMGSAAALGMEHKIGNFQVGKQFDALLVDAHVSDSPILECEERVDTFERFLYNGDDRNIVGVYVAGKLVHHRAAEAPDLVQAAADSDAPATGSRRTRTLLAAAMLGAVMLLS